jgi:hypothetical protein
MLQVEIKLEEVFTSSKIVCIRKITILLLWVEMIIEKYISYVQFQILKKLSFEACCNNVKIVINYIKMTSFYSISKILWCSLITKLSKLVNV